MCGNEIILEFLDIDGGNFGYIQSSIHFNTIQMDEYRTMMERIGVILKYRKNTLNLLRRIILNSKGEYSLISNIFPVSVWVDDIFCVDFIVLIKRSKAYLQINEIKYIKDGIKYILPFASFSFSKYSTVSGLSYDKLFSATTFIKDNKEFNIDNLVAEIDDFMLDYTNIDNSEDITDD